MVLSLSYSDTCHLIALHILIVLDKLKGKQHANNAIDLPGHKDEVYAVDWSPDGQKVGSGGKDKAIRVWRH